MPWIKVWIHFVWSTKDHEPYLTEEIRQTVFQHIRENAKLKGIYIDYINGYVDHVHCLISLGADQTIEKVMQLIKGESSFWINKNNLTRFKFAWQDEYFAASVSPSGIRRFESILLIRNSIIAKRVLGKSSKGLWFEPDSKGLVVCRIRLKPIGN